MILILYFFIYITYSYNKSCIEDYDCDDDIWCNGIETCDLYLNECINGSNPCNTYQYSNHLNITCNEEIKICNISIICYNDYDCNDNFICNGIEICNLNLNRCEKSKINICSPSEICNTSLNKCILVSNNISNKNQIPSIWIMILTIILIIMVSFIILFFITVYIFNKK